MQAKSTEIQFLMKLITTPKQLSAEFHRLIREYRNYEWATAWAGVSSDLFAELKKNKKKIKRLVVGLHFYQTHPDFIEEFIDNNNVRFVEQTSGTFHPKFYLFYNEIESWELLIGSGNFTNGAFTVNTEATLLVSSSQHPTLSLPSCQNFIELCWNQGITFSDEKLMQYRVAWKNQRTKLASLSGIYNSNTSPKITTKPLHTIDTANYSWKEFARLVQLEPKKDTENRIKVLSYANAMFKKVDHFHQLSADERRFIAGLPNKLDFGEFIDWGWFGSMRGNGIFHKHVLENDKNISAALDFIPLTGTITKDSYDSYIELYSKAFHRNSIATATRLLAIKRPDFFICLDSKNAKELCKDFGIVRTGMTYERYWDEIIMRIQDFEWYLNTKPKNHLEREIADSRVAFLDALYYDYNQDNW
jgi:hypothetical protein